MSATIDGPHPRATGAHLPGLLARRAAAPGVTALLLLVPLLGPGWLYVPANPAAKTPKATLTFNDLHDLANSGLVPTNAIQEAYFGWLGWGLALAIIALAVAAAIVHQRLLAFALGALSVVGLACTVLGVKGVLTWSQLVDQIENIRLGGYLVVLGYLIALGISVAQVSRRP